MKNNSNLILSVVLVVGFMFLWDSLVVSRFAPKKTPVGSAQSTPLPQSSVPPSTSPALIKTQKAAGPSTTKLHSPTTEVTVESWGGKISSWKIKERDYWIELVPINAVSKTLPLQTFPDLNFGIESSAADKIVLSALHPNGFLVRKTISLNPTSNLNSVSLEFKNISHAPLSVDTSLGWGEGLAKHVVGNNNGKQSVDAHFAEMRAVAFAGRIMHWKPGVIFGREVNETSQSSFEWAGVDNNHFLAAFIPLSGKIEEIKVFANRKTAPIVDIPFKLALAPGESKLLSFNLYVGPKKTSDLKAIGYDLEKAISFGTFGFISKGLLHLLEYFKKATGNYGWAIVILTVCLQIAVFPLTRKSLSHSVRMRELQPQLKQLQAQFKSDPKRLQIETMNLYKKNGMNFMGLEGCFPVLLQIPVFFAFYSALNGAYELRGAPWIFWIKDLAAPDAYHVLPVLMGLGMFFQQKLTTVPTDPSQATMMKLMPVIFVFMFFKMPAGLVLYWSINSVCTIVGQRLLQWQKNSQAQSSP